jgi:hypothetical protein
MKFLNKTSEFKPLPLQLESIHEVNLLWNMLANVSIEDLGRMLPGANKAQIKEVCQTIEQACARIQKDYKITTVFFDYERINPRSPEEGSGSTRKVAGRAKAFEGTES